VAQHFADRLVRRERLLVAAAEQHVSAAGVRLPRELRGEARLADARLAGENDQPRAAARRGIAPRAAQGGKLRVAADERARLGAGQRRRQRDRVGRRRLADRRHQFPRRGRRRDGEAVAETPRQRVVARERRGAVARRREQPDQLAAGLLAQRVERGALAREPYGAREVAGDRRLRGERAERDGQLVQQPFARVVHPFVLEAHQQLAAARKRERLLDALTCEQVLALAQIDLETVAREAHVPARRHEVPGGRAECMPELGQRAAQARAGALFEDVGPEQPS